VDTYANCHPEPVVSERPDHRGVACTLVGLDTEFTAPESGTYAYATHPWSIQLAYPTGDTRTITFEGETYTHNIYVGHVIRTHRLSDKGWLVNLLSQSATLKIAHYATADRHALDNWLQRDGGRRSCINVRDSHLESRLAFLDASEFGLKYLATYVLQYERQPTFEEVAAGRSVEAMVMDNDDAFLRYAARDAVLAAELWEIATQVRRRQNDQ
jgi:hypothetical protein